MDISLCLIVKDEEETLGKCLDSVSPAIDEIVVVDTGSADATKEIAALYGARLYDYSWTDDFSAARNFSFSKAKCEYTFWLDADDYLPASEVEKFIYLKNNLSPEIDAVRMLYFFNEQSRSRISRIRLVKNGGKFIWRGRVHEYLDGHGKILPSGIRVKHAKTKPYSDRNLKIYQAMIDCGQIFTARDTFYYANELYSNGRYLDAVKYYRQFLNGNDGAPEDKQRAALRLGYALYREGDEYGELEAYLLSLRFCGASAECCCAVGDYFLRRQQYEWACEWYKEALSLPALAHSYSFYDPDYEHYIPLLKLARCYDALGESKTARAFEKAALAYAPNGDGAKEDSSPFVPTSFDSFSEKI